MKAEKIKMKEGCGNSSNIQEIDEICVDGNFYKKEVIYDYLIMRPKSILVNIYPYPYLVSAKSRNGEKYVRSAQNDSPNDNLLKLPRT